MGLPRTQFKSFQTSPAHWLLESDARALSHIHRIRQQQGVALMNAEEKKAQLKKLNAQATSLKMDLHDLAEDLPTGWERIMEVADKTYRAYLSLDQARKDSANAES